MSDPLHETVIATVDRRQLWHTGATVVVAVSGGQDSCALLHSLHELGDRWQLSLHAATYDHMLRGAESETDACAVADFARNLSIPCTVGRGDVAAAAKRLHRSKQEVARDLRRQFLLSVARDTGANHIALGHTIDDRIETVLLNIVRGTGIDGLEGIAPISGPFVRPLIDAARNETAAYCEQHHLPVRIDPSNQTAAYSRNRVRQELLPLLAAYYNPGVREAIRRLSDLATDDAEFLRMEALDRYANAEVESGVGRVLLSVMALRSEPKAMQRRLVRLAIERVRGTLHGLEYETVEQIVSQIRDASAGPRFKLTLAPGDITVGIDGETFICKVVQPSLAVIPWSRAIALPGVTRVEPCGLEIVAEEVPAGVHPDVHANMLLLDPQSIRGNLTVRNRRPGDRLTRAGMAGSQKVQDLFTDRKVARGERDFIPIVVDEEGILWVVGHAVSERARPGTKSGGGLLLKVRPFRASNCREET